MSLCIVHLPVALDSPHTTEQDKFREDFFRAGENFNRALNEGHKIVSAEVVTWRNQTFIVYALHKPDPAPFPVSSEDQDPAPADDDPITVPNVPAEGGAS